MSRAKRHHYVPAAYLARFGADRKVAVRRRGGAGVHVTNVANVAVETGFYELVDDSGQPTDALERELSRVESFGLKAIGEIEAAESPPSPGSPLRRTLATFLALQFTRTPVHRERILFPIQVMKYAGDRAISEPLMADFLTNVHLGFRPSPSEIRGALTYVQVALQEPEFFDKNNVIGLTMRMVEKASGVLLALNWNLEVARKPRLITSDTPMVLWRKPSYRDNYEGIGLRNSEEIRFPLSPATQLVLTHIPRDLVRRVEPARVRECNADMSRSCFRAIIGRPQRPQDLRTLKLRPRRQVVRFNMRPGYRTLPDGSREPLGDVLQQWVPRGDGVGRLQG